MSFTSFFFFFLTTFGACFFISFIFKGGTLGSLNALLLLLLGMSVVSISGSGDPSSIVAFKSESSCWCWTLEWRWQRNRRNSSQVRCCVNVGRWLANENNARQSPSFILTPPTPIRDKLDSLVQHWPYNRKDYTCSSCEIVNFTIFTDDTVNGNSLYRKISFTVLIEVAQ